MAASSAEPFSIRSQGTNGKSWNSQQQSAYSHFEAFRQSLTARERGELGADAEWEEMTNDALQNWKLWEKFAGYMITRAIVKKGRNKGRTFHWNTATNYLRHVINRGKDKFAGDLADRKTSLFYTCVDPSSTSEARKRLTTLQAGTKSAGFKLKLQQGEPTDMSASPLYLKELG